jgi:outer membrane lipoprotein SlyB
MKCRYLWSAVLLMLAISLSGCSANHKFNDDEYRPLGDPKAAHEE